MDRPFFKNGTPSALYFYSGTYSSAPDPSSLQTGTTAWFTDKPDSKGGAFVVRESSGTPGTYIYDRIGGGPIVHDKFANCVSGYNMTTYDGCTFRCTDIGVTGTNFIATGGLLRAANYSGSAVYLYNPTFDMSSKWILFGGSGGTYSQTGTTITVTKASHGLVSGFNGASVHLSISTGLAITGTFSNFTYVDANTFAVTSSVSQSTSGNLASNTAKTYMPWTYTAPAGLIKAGDQLFLTMLWRRCSNSANNKTLSFEYSGVLMGSLFRTTAGVNWLFEGPTAAYYVGDSTFLGGTATPTPYTDTTSTYAITGQLSNGADWDLYSPPAIYYVPRSPLS